jgi:hypothetical protein
MDTISAPLASIGIDTGRSIPLADIGRRLPSRFFFRPPWVRF